MADIKNNKVINYFSIVIAILMLIIFIYRFYRNDYKEEMLLNTNSAFGIVTKIKGSGYRSPAYCDYRYNINNRDYEGSTHGKYPYLKIGDTVEIKYSIKDNSISTLTNSYYMSKYRDLKVK